MTAAGAPAGLADPLVLSAGGGVVDFGVGAKVRMVDGVFAGRAGVVSEIDVTATMKKKVSKHKLQLKVEKVRNLKDSETAGVQAQMEARLNAWRGPMS